MRKPVQLIASAQPSKSVVLLDSIILALAGRPAVVSEFPFLRLSVKPTSTCGRCRRNQATQTQTLEIERIRQTIANMSPERKERFKVLLGAGRISFFIKGPRGVQKHEF